MKKFLFASTALASPVAYVSHGPLETVTVIGEDGNPLRINKSDYDADQADGGAKKYELHADEAAQSNGPGAALPLPDGISQVAAPAAPDFTNGSGQPDNTVIDGHKNAVAPTAPSPGQKLVQKDGRKFFVVVAGPDNTFPRLTGVKEIDEGGYKTEKDAWDAIMALPA